jgi:regulator of sirC expression with transglutaminase-like and TPR domain
MHQPPSASTLVPLLGDGSSTSRKTVKEALLSLGDAAIPALRHAADGADAVLRARARQILIELRRRRGLQQLREILVDPGASLEAGLLAIDEVLGAADPALDVAGQLDAWAVATSERLEENAPAEQAGAALHQVLAVEAGLRGASSDFHNSLHVSLTRTVEDRRGLPLTLCAVYALVGRRAGMEIALLPFPGHVLLMVRGESSQQIVDPFSGGTPLDEAACLARLRQLGIAPSSHWFEPAPDAEMLTRQLRNLAAAMRRHGRNRDAVEIMALLEHA